MKMVQLFAGQRHQYFSEVMVNVNDLYLVKQMTQQNITEIISNVSPF